MINPRWLIGLGQIWIVGNLLGGIIEQRYLGNVSASIFDILLGPDVPAYTDPIAGAAAWITIPFRILQVVWRWLTWDYAMLADEWILLRMFGWVISFGIIITLALAITRRG